MRHIDFIGLRKDKADILSDLSKFGFVEISAPVYTDEQTGETVEKETAMSEKASEWAAKRDTLLKAMDVLSQYDTRKKGLFASRRTISEAEYQKVIDSADEIMKKAEEANSFAGRISEMDKSAAMLSSKVSRLFL